jgi:hypothetical protein
LSFRRLESRANPGKLSEQLEFRFGEERHPRAAKPLQAKFDSPLSVFF